MPVLGSENKFLHCFTCGETFCILDVYTADLYKCNIVKKTQPGEKLNLTIDDMLLCMKKVNIIDAPCGGGKTHNVARYLTLLGKETYCAAVTHRKALTITLGERFGMISYTRIPIGAKNPEYYRKISICANSLVRIPKEFEDKYECVVLDKAGYLCKHFATNTMNNIWNTVSATNHFFLSYHFTPHPNVNILIPGVVKARKNSQVQPNDIYNAARFDRK